MSSRWNKLPTGSSSSLGRSSFSAAKLPAIPHGYQPASKQQQTALCLISFCGRDFVFWRLSSPAYRICLIQRCCVRIRDASAAKEGRSKFSQWLDFLSSLCQEDENSRAAWKEERSDFSLFWTFSPSPPFHSDRVKSRKIDEASCLLGLLTVGKFVFVNRLPTEGTERRRL